MLRVPSENGAYEVILHCQGKWGKVWTDASTETYLSGFLKLIIGTSNAYDAEDGTQPEFRQQTLQLAEFYQKALNEKIATNFNICAGNGAMIPCHRSVLEGTNTL